MSHPKLHVDGNDTTIISYHPYIHFAMQLCTPQNSLHAH